MFGGIWHHLHGHRWAGNVSRASEDTYLDPRHPPESFQDATSERFVEEHLGGIEAERLIDSGKRPDD